MEQPFPAPFAGLSVHPPLGLGTNRVPPERGGTGDTPGANVGEDVGGDVRGVVGELVDFF